jgi:hypothetical protein
LRLTDDEVECELFARWSDHPELLYVDEDGKRRIDFDRLFDLIRSRRKSPTPESDLRQCDRSESIDGGEDDAASVESGLIAAEVRDEVDSLRRRSPAHAAAIEHLQGAPRPGLASKFGVTEDQIRTAEKKVRAELRKRFGDGFRL